VRCAACVEKLLGKDEFCTNHAILDQKSKTKGRREHDNASDELWQQGQDYIQATYKGQGEKS
jgi:hypothetical protein